MDDSKVRFVRYWNILVIAILMLGLLDGCAHGTGGDVETPPEEVTVMRGSLVTSITALGSIRPGAEAVLSFQVPGRVTEVLIRAGQQVQREQPLARLETADLELQVRSAEASLATVQAQLDQVQAGPKAEEVRAARGQLAAAEASLDQAVAQRDQLITGTQKSEVTVAESQVAWRPGSHSGRVRRRGGSRTSQNRLGRDAGRIQKGVGSPLGGPGYPRWVGQGVATSPVELSTGPCAARSCSKQPARTRHQPAGL